MKTQAGYQLQAYEVSGKDLRIHWEIEEKTKEGLEGVPIVYWEANEALCDVLDNRNQIIEKVIGSMYSTAEEFAAINNKDTKPEAYAAYQALRSKAKDLADGWLNRD